MPIMPRLEIVKVLPEYSSGCSVPVRARPARSRPPQKWTGGPSGLHPGPRVDEAAVECDGYLDVDATVPGDGVGPHDTLTSGTSAAPVHMP